MFAVATVASLLGYGLLLNRFFKWPLESTFLFVGTSITLFLYFAALADVLGPSSQLLMGLGIILFVALIIPVVKETGNVSITSPGTVFFLVGSILLTVLVSTDYYSFFIAWDDFSNWARTAKVIYYNNGLVQADDPVWQKDYPPGSVLFHYFVFQISGFSVSAAFFAQGLLILAACSQLLLAVPKGRWLALILSSLFFYCSIHYFGTGFHTLMVDLLVALLFASGVVSYWLSDRSSNAVVRIIPVILVLPVIKMMGMAFAGIIIAIIVFDQMWLLKQKKSVISSLLLALLMVPALFVIHASWQNHFESMGATKTFNPDVSIEKIINSFDSNISTERQKITIERFVEASTHPKNAMKFILILIAAMMIIYFENNKTKKGSAAIQLFGLLGGLAAYLLLLLVLYLFFFGAYEGPRLASFARYLGTYIVALYLILFSILLQKQLNENSGKKVTLVFLLLFTVSTAMPSTRHVITDLKYAVGLAEVSSGMKMLENYSAAVSVKVPEDKKVYFIWQNSTGYQMQVFSYGIIPRLSNQGCWSVGEKYYAGDVWTCAMDTEELAKYVSGYDYLFVGHADAAFWKRYEKLFGNKKFEDGELFKVVRIEGSLQFLHAVL